MNGSLSECRWHWINLEVGSATLALEPIPVYI